MLASQLGRRCYCAEVDSLLGTCLELQLQKELLAQAAPFGDVSRVAVPSIIKDDHSESLYYLQKLFRSISVQTEFSCNDGKKGSLRGSPQASRRAASTQTEAQNCATSIQQGSSQQVEKASLEGIAY